MSHVVGDKQYIPTYKGLFAIWLRTSVVGFNDARRVITANNYSWGYIKLPQPCC